MFRRKDSDLPQPTSDAAPKPAEPEMPKSKVEAPSVLKPMAGSNPAPDSAKDASKSQTSDKSVAPTVDAKGKRLIVGQGISLSGTITACDRLVVEGKVQVTLNETRAIEITETGQFTEGKAEVEEAEISGTYEGELTVRKRLHIRSSGQVKGDVRYGELEIDRGGKLTGTVSMLDS